jgi:GNAT superfamily N-acetyltransferase
MVQTLLTPGHRVCVLREVSTALGYPTRLAADVHGRRHLSWMEVVWAMAAAEAYVWAIPCNTCYITLADNSTQIMIETIYPSDENEVRMIRELFRGFESWMRERYKHKLHLIDEMFASYDEELADLPNRYAPPQGNLLLALRERQALGCVALRRIDDDCCEMARMFVDSAFQKQGVGRLLAERLISDAKVMGFKIMNLRTGKGQHEAIGLYQSLGFETIPEPEGLPERWKNEIRFMTYQIA